MPIEEITAQELVYAARACRVEASQDREKATRPAFFSSKVIYEDAAASLDELAGKFDRIAKEMRKKEGAPKDAS